MEGRIQTRMGARSSQQPVFVASQLHVGVVSRVVMPRRDETRAAQPQVALQAAAVSSEAQQWRDVGKPQGGGSLGRGLFWGSVERSREIAPRSIRRRKRK